MVKECVLSTGYLPRGGLPRNSVDRITDHPDMTLAVDRGRKASTKTNKQTNKQSRELHNKHAYAYSPLNDTFINSKTGIYRSILVNLQLVIS